MKKPRNISIVMREDTHDNAVVGVCESGEEAHEFCLDEAEKFPDESYQYAEFAIGRRYDQNGARYTSAQ